MTTQLLLGWLWDDLTRTPSHIAFTIACVLLIVLNLIIVHSESRHSLLFGFIIIVVGLLEAFGFIYNETRSFWIFDSFGNFFFGIVVIIAVCTMMYYQFNITKGILNLISDEGGFYNKYELGYSSMIPGFIIIFIALLFGEQYGQIAAILFLLFQLYIVGATIYSTIVNNGSMSYAIFSVAVYIVNILGIIFLLCNFILPAIAYIVMMFFIKGGNDASCSNCRSYNDGYCYYRQKYVSSNSCCNKHES